VGIVGLGGIGHFSVLFSKALGAETWVVSGLRTKEADAKNLGANSFLVTADKDWAVEHRMTFDLIINTANSTDAFFPTLDQFKHPIQLNLKRNAHGLTYLRPGKQPVLNQSREYKSFQDSNNCRTMF